MSPLLVARKLQSAENVSFAMNADPFGHCASSIVVEISLQKKRMRSLLCLSSVLALKWGEPLPLRTFDEN